MQNNREVTSTTKTASQEEHSVKAMKRAIMLLSLAMLVTVAWAKDKNLKKVNVEVVEQEGSQGTAQAGGLVGAAVGRRVSTDAWTAKVIINGEHAMLTCYENHSRCHFMAAGTYDGELKTHSMYEGSISDPDLWIHFIRPIDHVDIREHWKITGSW
jgi:hypothetical protein